MIPMLPHSAVLGGTNNSYRLTMFWYVERNNDHTSHLMLACRLPQQSPTTTIIKTLSASEI